MTVHFMLETKIRPSLLKDIVGMIDDYLLKYRNEINLEERAEFGTIVISLAKNIET